MFNTIKKIHFVGIGGAGMSGIAEVLVNLGYVVSGSDIKRSPITDKLENMGVHLKIGHSEENVDGCQVVVVSSAVGKHNPEILASQSQKIPVVHRSEMLAELMRMKYGIVVAGTHGKTTTTSILAEALHVAGLDPTAIIGGKINSFGSNAKLGKGDIFVAEADESDGSFLRLSPTIAVVTNIDRDHLDFYGNLEEIIKAFETFVNKIPFYGSVCLCLDDPIAQLLLLKIRRKVVTYGLRPDADVYASDIITRGFETQFTPVVFGEKYPSIVLHIPGVYNVVNALASFAVAATLNLDLHVICRAVSSFAGVLHRYTLLGEHRGVFVVDDYAHNPKKIQTVLKGTKESFPEKQIFALFQPHRYSRVKYQFEEFGAAFLNADYVIVTPI